MAKSYAKTRISAGMATFHPRDSVGKDTKDCDSILHQIISNQIKYYIIVRPKVGQRAG